MGTLTSRHTEEAVALLKQGVAPGAVVQRLVSLNASPDEAQLHVANLVRMKQEAEAAAGAPPPIDVERIRDVMWNMMLRRAPMEDIVAAVAPYGIAQEHIGAEVRRLAQFKPCGMCGTRMAPGESYFNTSGTEICRRCNAGESIAAADRRVWEAAAEAGGMSAAEIAARSQPQRCPRCGQDTLMAAGAINFDTGIVREAHRCGSCGFQTR